MATLTIARTSDPAGNKQTGSITVDDGSVIDTVTADQTVTVNPGWRVVYNYTGSSYSLPGGVQTAAGGTSISAHTFSCVPASFDITTDAAQAVLVEVGMVSDQPDPISGNLYLENHHPGSHEHHGQHIAPGSVHLGHHAKASPHRGHLVGGTARAASNGTTTNLYFLMGASSDMVEFITDDGTGDGQTIQGGPDGAYVICTPTQVLSASDVAYASRPLIGDPPGGGIQPAAQWPASGPARAMISFCTVFPGGTVGNPSASGTGFTIRYCFTRSVTLNRTAGSVQSNVTQTIESPLSTPIQTPTLPVTFTMQPLPQGWTGYRIYADQTPASQGPAFLQLTQGTHYTLSGNVATVSTLTPFGTVTPSYGFAAWPSGTQLAIDQRAIQAGLMKWAHLSQSRDGNTGNYTVMPYNSNGAEKQPSHLQPKTILTPHLKTNNSYSSGNVLGQDGSGNLSWVTGGSGGGSGKAFTWRGGWSSGVTYYNNSTEQDVVYYSGSSYICVSAGGSINSTSPPPNDTGNWQLMSQQGATGSTGATGSQGPQGPTGPQGPAGANGTGFTWRGSWGSGTAYNANDVVYYGGNSYVCVGANTGVTPGTNGSYWQTMSVGQEYTRSGWVNAQLSFPSTTGTGTGTMITASYSLPFSPNFTSTPSSIVVSPSGQWFQVPFGVYADQTTLTAAAVTVTGWVWVPPSFTISGGTKSFFWEAMA